MDAIYQLWHIFPVIDIRRFGEEDLNDTTQQLLLAYFKKTFNQHLVRSKSKGKNLR